MTDVTAYDLGTGRLTYLSTEGREALSALKARGAEPPMKPFHYVPDFREMAAQYLLKFGGYTTARAAELARALDRDNFKDPAGFGFDFEEPWLYTKPKPGPVAYRLVPLGISPCGLPCYEREYLDGHTGKRLWRSAAPTHPLDDGPDGWRAAWAQLPPDDVTKVKKPPVSGRPKVAHDRSVRTTRPLWGDDEV